jgi:hypothetical protein
MTVMNAFNSVQVFIMYSSKIYVAGEEIHNAKQLGLYGIK